MKLNHCFPAIPALALAVGLQSASAADITGTITLKGTPPPEQVNEDIKLDAYCGAHQNGVVKTQFYVVGANQGLKDVVVVVRNITGKSTGATAAPVMLDQQNCMYSPYILAVQTGQKISVHNGDKTMHNVHTYANTPGNPSENKTQMADSADVSFAFTKPEDFLKFSCDVHRWMLSYVTVVDSPYFAVTDKDGKFTIKDVPAGKNTVEIMHRKAGKLTKDVDVAGGNVTLDFTLEVPAAK